MSDNSHYSIVKDLLLPLFDQVSKLQHSKRGTQTGVLSVQVSTPAVRDSPGVGGGEGIRTPDPRVANAVLCQLSYTP